MNRKIVSGLACSMLAAGLWAGQALADDTPKDGSTAAKKVEKSKQERVYGNQMMTREERLEQREKMREAKTREERKQLRKEHHDKMKERAKERGVTLPDQPPAQRGGMGPGMGGMGGMGGGTGGAAPGTTNPAPGATTR